MMERETIRGELMFGMCVFTDALVETDYLEAGSKFFQNYKIFYYIIHLLYIIINNKKKMCLIINPVSCD